MAEIVTVDYLLDLLQRLSKSGNGDMKIKCRENFLHEDEIFINLIDGQIEMRGNMFNLPVSKKVRKFCDDINRAKNEFYQADIICKESEE